MEVMEFTKLLVIGIGMSIYTLIERELIDRYGKIRKKLKYFE